MLYEDNRDLLLIMPLQPVPLLLSSFLLFLSLLLSTVTPLLVIVLLYIHDNSINHHEYQISTSSTA